MVRLEPRHLQVLARGWSALRLAAECPDRFPSWDVVILSAADEAQARWYERRLEEIRSRGHLPPNTQCRVVPDPAGRRIGSGGATLHALRALAREAGPADADRLRVLLLHSGGDSRRVPWAGRMGKIFMPLPLLADPDSPVPTLLDHLLAIAAPLSFQLESGGLLTLAGDVLPLFDASRAPVPADGGWVVTCPVPLDLASRHGVIVPASDGSDRVAALLQKPSPEELARSGALSAGGIAQLDTGIWAFTGSAWRGLWRAAQTPGLVEEILAEERPVSLYEDLAGLLLPEVRSSAGLRPWARPLAEAWAGVALTHYRAAEMAFLHFGTTAEILEHLGRPTWYGALSHRVLSEDGPLAAPDAIILESQLNPRSVVGSGTLVFGSRLGEGAVIGRRCVVVGVDDHDESWTAPDNTCVWQIHLRARGDNRERTAWLCCGADDAPDAPWEQGTFLNTDFRWWMQNHGVSPGDLWPDGPPRTLWHARLFPVLEAPASLRLTSWLMGPGGGAGDPRWYATWLAAPRISLAEVAREADLERGWQMLEDHCARLALTALHRAVVGRLDRNLLAIAQQLRSPGRRLRALSLTDRLPDVGSVPAAAEPVPFSRLLQMRADLLEAAGEGAAAQRAADAAFAAVQEEVARAVAWSPPPAVSGCAPARVVVELPARFDISGGWSDTPPYCLERPALVLNFAMRLEGRRPIRVEAETLDEPVWELENEDLGIRRRFTSGDLSADSAQGFDDPFLLARTALRIAGFGGPGGITQGVRLRTRTDIPKGSGLGTSSILGAAVLRALARLAGTPDDVRMLSDRVLVLEQQMRTGGGWQDQIGGLAPGIKCIRTWPVRPLRMHITPVPITEPTRRALEARFVLVFTGQQRLARNILQRVVERYLRRERRTLEAIGRLVELADEGRAALAMGDLDALGLVLREAWAVLQQLTPECSNPRIDRLFREVEPWALGTKLAGAGGGGFMGVLARDEEAAERIRRHLVTVDPAIRVYPWSLDLGDD